MRQVITFLTLSIASTVAAQDAKTALERARLVAKAEANPLQAIALYRKIASNGTYGAADKTRALFELGTCLARLGKRAEADAAFKQAAAGQGPAAQAAKDRLAGKTGQADARVQQRVAMLLAQFVKPDYKKAYSNLLWIGQPAVPQTVEMIWKDRLNLDFVTRASELVLRLGGEGVDAFLARVQSDEDPLLRRAVARGLLPCRASPLRLRVLRFLEDTNPRVRNEALAKIGRYLTVAELLDDLERHPTPTQRWLGWLEKAWHERNNNRAANTERFLPVFKKLLHSKDMNMRRRAAGLWRLPTFTNDVFARIGGLAYWLDWVAETDISLRNGTWTAFGGGAARHPVPSSSVLAVAKVVAGKTSSRSDSRRMDLDRLIRALLPAWETRNAWGVIDLVTLGFDTQGRLWKWLQTHATPKHYGRIIDHVSAFASPASVAKWFKLRGRASSVVSSLLRQIEIQLARKPRNRTLVKQLAIAVGGVADSEAEAALVELVERETWLWKTVARGLIGAKDNSARLRRMLALPQENSAEYTADVRDSIVKRLVQNTVPDIGRALGKAYELGLQRRPSGQVPRGLQWLFVLTQGPVPSYIHAYSDDQIAAIVDATLAASPTNAAFDLPAVLSQDGYRCPSQVVEVLCKRVERIESVQLRQVLIRSLLGGRPVAVPAARELAARLLASGDRRRQMLAIGSMRGDITGQVELLLPFVDDKDENVSAAMLVGLAKNRGDARARKALVAGLGDRRAGIRATAAAQLVLFEGAKGIEHVLPLLRDHDIGVRLAAIKACATALDRRAVPGLLEALKDRSESIRKAATRALSAISFYEDQQVKWRSWYRNIGAKTPIDALLKQIDKAQPKRIRLVAIDSLGTLGEAQALPLLIDLMKSGDEEIARRAGAAVAKINSKK